MQLQDVMTILQDMDAAVFATVDEDGNPHARFMYIGVANEHGLFFMTGKDTSCYQQLMANNQVAVTAMLKQDYLIQVIRMEGKAKPVGEDYLKQLLEENPYVDYVYPDETAKETIQVFHLYEGDCFYQSLTQGHRYEFSFGKK
ncbi:pyridoxamine 5'-phosphate oxidase family protein [Streptococcus cameli]